MTYGAGKEGVFCTRGEQRSRGRIVGCTQAKDRRYVCLSRSPSLCLCLSVCLFIYLSGHYFLLGGSPIRTKR